MKPRPEPSFEEVDRFVAEHPDGVAREDIAIVFGCSRQRIEQIERKALRKIYIRLSLANVWFFDDLT